MDVDSATNVDRKSQVLRKQDANLERYVLAVTRSRKSDAAVLF